MQRKGRILFLRSTGVVFQKQSAVLKFLTFRAVSESLKPELFIYTITTYWIFSENGYSDILISESEKGGHKMSKSLIAFYSRADENYVRGTIKILDVGNTEIAANIIKKITGADVFKIEQKTPYSKRYNDCTQEAEIDQQQNARPELKCFPDSIEEYDIIYLGFPNYWSTMPMAVFTFLEHFDFSGKVIKPFCTHEGSGMGSSISDIKTLCPNAKVESGLAIYGSKIDSSIKDIGNWLQNK